MNGLCTGAQWRDQSLVFALRGEDEKMSYHTLGKGDEITFQIIGTRRCIGHRPPGKTTLVTCPTNKEDLSANQCPDCFEQSHILPCLRCTGERCANPIRRPFCVQPDNHAVYLASFAPGIIKVGVSRWERRLERLSEQGARAAIIIAREDGQMVRRIESQYKNFVQGIGDRLAPTEKLRAYTYAGSQAKLLQELEDTFEQTSIRIMGEWLDEVEQVPLPDLPVLAEKPRLMKIKPDMKLRGNIVGVYGHLLVIDADTNERVAVETSSLVGYKMRALTENEVGEGQMTLALF